MILLLEHDPHCVRELQTTKTRTQEMWPAIAATRPDVWMWLGDAVYADTRSFPLTIHVTAPSAGAGRGVTRSTVSGECS